jgi:hypothetical protein
MASGKKWNFKDFREADDKAKAGRKFKDFLYACKNNGVFADGEKLDFKDAITMNDYPLFLPKVINMSVQEAIEPMLVVTKFLQTLPFVQGMQVDMPVVMGAASGEYEVGEEESYPTFRVAYGPGTAISSIGKQGLQVSFTEEAIKYLTFPIVDTYMSQAAKALARYKEEKVFHMLYKIAEPSHDNDSPQNSAHGTTSGRDMTGAQNGTITMEDIFEMWVTLQHNGFTPDVMFVHPLTWLTFIQDPYLRHFAQTTNSPWFGGQWTGSPSKNDYQSMQGGQGIPGQARRGHSTYAVGNDGDGNPLPSGPDDYSQNLNVAPVLPGYLGIPMRIVVSPFVPYNAVDNTTTILMADSNELGFMLVEEGLGVKEWTSPENDILHIRLKERYSIRPKNRGMGLVVAKNVHIGSNQIMLPAQSIINVAGSIDPLVRDVAI